eukprot:CAMPEP_0172510212 /NCGR_PEP_ID=MMETSP1066-20121228/227029_1 /TAXON_ID=671091 /ORGANISM="Coscinodiscus wailesii, Strain CCMP2513" /LENGTH=421 /DNA_ID=CAMNT_0013289079 /DNA_START=394 /DNA_END=1659 /DNA_ORIENTATION=+
MTKWYHLECFNLPRKLLKEGIDARRFVQEMLEDTTNDGNLEEIEEKVIEAIETKPVPKNDVGGNSGGEGAKERMKRVRETWEGMRDDEDEEPKPKKKKKGDKKGGGGGVDKLELARAYGIYAEYNNNELKDVLRWNKQMVGGTKDILLQRILDGHVNGRLGLCPTCSEGKLKLEDDGETVKCPGWFDKENMMRHPCFYTCKRADAPRIQPWYTEKPPEDDENSKENIKEDMNSPLSILQASASEIKWDLSQPTGLKSAAKELIRVSTEHSKHKVAIPEDKTKARMEIGKILLSNRKKTSSEVMALLVKQFGFVAQKESAKEKKAELVSAHCQCPDNGFICMPFMEMSDLYFKEGNKNAGTSYKKAVAAIQAIDFKITKANALGLGKGKTKVAGIGKGTSEKIHELLTTGKIEKLEEKRAGA